MTPDTWDRRNSPVNEGYWNPLDRVTFTMAYDSGDDEVTITASRAFFTNVSVESIVVDMDDGPTTINLGAGYTIADATHLVIAAASALGATLEQVDFYGEPAAGGILRGTALGPLELATAEFPTIATITSPSDGVIRITGSGFLAAYAQGLLDRVDIDFAATDGGAYDHAYEYIVTGGEADLNAESNPEGDGEITLLTDTVIEITDTWNRGWYVQRVVLFDFDYEWNEGNGVQLVAAPDVLVLGVKYAFEKSGIRIVDAEATGNAGELLLTMEAPLMSHPFASREPVTFDLLWGVSSLTFYIDGSSAPAAEVVSIIGDQVLLHAAGISGQSIEAASVNYVNLTGAQTNLVPPVAVP